MVVLVLLWFGGHAGVLIFAGIERNFLGVFFVFFFCFEMEWSFLRFRGSLGCCEGGPKDGWGF